MSQECRLTSSSEERRSWNASFLRREARTYRRGYGTRWKRRSRRRTEVRHRHCSASSRRYTVNWFNLSVLGWVILIIALAIAGYKLHVPTLWIAIATLALLGIGII